jgi:biotin operon repressor
VGHFEAAAEKGIDTHELGKLLGLTHGAAQHHIETLRHSGEIIKSVQANGNRPARYWLAQYTDAAKAHRYPFVPAPKVAKSKQAKAAPIADKCLAIIRSAGRQGINTADLAEKMGMSRGSVLNRIQAARVAGLIVRLWDGTKNSPAYWYIAGCDPISPPKTTTIRAANTGLDKTAPAIIPKGLKITKCPSADPNGRWKAKQAPQVVNSQESRPWAAALTARN